MVLKIYKKLEQIKEFPLQIGQSYFIGSSNECHLQIEQGENILEFHVEIAVDDYQQLQVKLVSNEGQLLFEGNQVETALVLHQENFHIEFYRFEFLNLEHNNIQEDISENDFFGELVSDTKSKKIEEEPLIEEVNFSNNSENELFSEEEENNNHFNEELSSRENTLPSNPSEESAIEEPDGINPNDNSFENNNQFNNDENINTGQIESEEEISNNIENNYFPEENESIDESPKEAQNQKVQEKNNNSNVFSIKRDKSGSFRNALVTNLSKYDNDFEFDKDKDEDTNAESQDDLTEIGMASTLALTLHIISNSSKKPKKTFKLKGAQWIAGRSKRCQIHLDYSFFSRKHFEIIKAEEGFYIKDLKSSLGTILNDKDLPSDEYIRIYDKDIISIKNINMLIELRDARLEELMKDFDDNKAIPLETNPALSLKPMKKRTSFKNFKGQKKSTSSFNPIRFLSVLVLIAGVYFYLDKQEKKPRDVASKEKIEKNIQKNKDEDNQQRKIMEKFSVAKSSYNRRDNISCISELAQLHKMVPSYKNSKQMLELCKQGLEIEKEQKIQSEREQQANEIERKSRFIANQCENKFPSFTRKNQIDQCLSELLILNPAHPTIADLNSRWDVKELQKMQTITDQKNYQSRVNAGKNLFNKAKSLKNKNKLRESMSVFKKLINNNYPGNENNISQAKREISSIQSSIQTRFKDLFSQCDSSHKQNNHKQTINNCKSLLKEFPKNSEARTFMKEAKKSISLKVKSIYQDASIEESLGNIAAAKEKWNEILIIDVKNGSYYKKANRKLQKYID